jgi:hypothetical protein
MAEVKFQLQIERLTKAQQNRLSYESEKFKYIIYEERTYTPDWVIKLPRSGRKIYVEYKGKLTIADRKKLLLVRKDNPDIDLRLVFQKPGNKLYRGSPTTYAQWADKHGFPWADNELPSAWLKGEL